MEDETRVDEATISSGDENPEENEGQGEDLTQELERERQARQQLTSRAKKAEEDLRTLREQLKEKEETPKPKTPTASPDVDERILKSQGMSDDLLKDLKVIAQVRGVGLIEAQNDSAFQAIKSNYEQEQKHKEASMGSSKGSGEAKPKVGFDTPNLSRDDHKALFKQKFQ